MQWIRPTTVCLFVTFLLTNVADAQIENPALVKLPIGFGPRRIENTPIVYQGRPLLIENSRLTNEVEPEQEDGINATDADLFEFLGNTYLFYGAGWQDSRGTIRVKMFPGTMQECLESYFSPTVPTIQFDARQGKYIYP